MEKEISGDPPPAEVLINSGVVGVYNLLEDAIASGDPHARVFQPLSYGTRSNDSPAGGLRLPVIRIISRWFPFPFSVFRVTIVAANGRFYEREENFASMDPRVSIVS